MALLDKSELLSKSSGRRYKIVKLDIGDIRIQSLTNTEMRQLRTSLLDRKGELIRERGDRMQELLISRCVLNADATPMFSDADALNGVFDSIDGGVVTTLFNACKKHTGFADDNDFTLIEDAVKNSENDPTKSSENA